jgi:hypothetical protein
MRLVAIVPVICLLAGCLAPGERDPTRYPWDPRNRVAPAPVAHPPIIARGLIPPIEQSPHPQPLRPEDSYCVMAIEHESRTGSTRGADAGVLACNAQPNAAPSSPPR